MLQVASGQSCSDASTRSIGRLAPLTTRTLIPAPPLARRSADHACSRIIALRASGRYACRTMPASRSRSSGLSRIAVKTAIVRSRSRYSSMSRLMNFGVGEAAACSEQRRQALHDVLDGLVERPGRVRADGRRDLDRHVVDVRDGPAARACPRAGGRLRVAEHRLAQQVDVEARPAPADLRDRLAQPRVRRIHDQVADHRPQRAPYERDHDAGARRVRPRLRGVRLCAGATGGTTARPGRGSRSCARRPAGPPAGSRRR